MVSTNDILLLGGGVLAAIYLSKRSAQVGSVPAIDYYQQVQTVDLQRLTEFGDRISQLKDIRSQILDYEKGIAEQKVSYIESEIQKAAVIGSEAQQFLSDVQQTRQPKLGYGFGFATRSISNAIQAASGNLQSAFDYFVRRGELSKAETISQIAELNQKRQTLALTQQFITQAEAQQADIMAKYSELEQIV